MPRPLGPEPTPPPAPSVPAAPASTRDLRRLHPHRKLRNCGVRNPRGWGRRWAYRGTGRRGQSGEHRQASAGRRRGHSRPGAAPGQGIRPNDPPRSRRTCHAGRRRRGRPAIRAAGSAKSRRRPRYGAGRPAGGAPRRAAGPRSRPPGGARPVHSGSASHRPGVMGSGSHRSHPA